MSEGALEGLLVVALEQAVAAPYCTSRLADAGARVIKIERPEGDFARAYDAAAGDVSSYFAWLNRGKQSLVADIKTPDDLALLRRMLAGADVFVQNLAPGAAARAGLGAEALREANPRLITVDISGYGDGHAYATMKAYDLLVQAETGLAGLTGRPEGPGRVGVSVCDIACGMNAHAAVLEALIRRGQIGQGSHIAVSLFDSVADWMNVPLLYWEGTGVTPQRAGMAHPSLAPYGAFTTADGVAVVISIQNEREWARFCDAVLDEPELAQAPGFAGSAARVANRAAVDATVARAFACQNFDAIAAALERAGTAWGRLNDLPGLARHPALRRLPVTVPGRDLSIVAPAPIVDGQSPGLGPVPALGEHSAEIRAEFAPVADGA
ncbi:MAG: CoA transferase [Pararhodobacter sp.]|nr:CoA transferase [Pararhodobacter sp.]